MSLDFPGHNTTNFRFFKAAFFFIKVNAIYSNKLIYEHFFHYKISQKGLFCKVDV